MKQMSPKNTCFRVQRPYWLSALTRLFLFSLPLYTGPRHRHFSFCRKAAVVKPLWNLKRKKRKKKKKKKEQTTFLTQNYVLTNFRPVVNLCILSKRIEKIVHDQHFCYVYQNNLWHIFQSTFIIILTPPDLIAAFNTISWHPSDSPPRHFRYLWSCSVLPLLLPGR